MKHKAAIVTGGAVRIGKSIALRLARLDYNIVLHYHSSEEEAQKTKSTIEQLGVLCHLVQTNLKEPEAGPALFEEISKEWEIEELINNATIFQMSDFHDPGVERFDKHNAINLRTPYSFTKSLILHRKHAQLITLMN